jgi:hypothetical protein
MQEITTGERRYRIHAADRNGEWVAHAERADTGDRFGPECTASSEAAVVDRVARWLGWQHEHAAALEALQTAERDYHRTVVGNAFVNQGEEATTTELKKALLERIDEHRVRLDAVRSRKPA